MNKNGKNPKRIDRNKMKSSFDVLGSYTGSYIAGENEEPVQDVDDL